MKMEDGLESEDTEVSKMGTRLHEAEWDQELYDSLPDDEKGLVDWCNGEVNRIACEFGISTWIGEMTMEIHHGGTFICFGTVDSHSEVAERQEFAVLIEKKFGYKDVEPSNNNIQVAAGSLALKQKYPQLKKILAVVIMPRIRKVFRHEFTKFDSIDQYVWNIRQRCVNASGKNCNAGSWCSDGYCKAISTCPAVNEVSESLTTIETTAITIDNAEEMYEKAMIVEKQLKAIKSRCKAVAIENGGEAGRLSVTESRGNRYIPDLQKAFESVQHLFEGDEFLGCCEAKLGKLEDETIGRVLQRGDYPTKKEAKAAFNELVGVKLKPNKQTINLRKG